MKCAIRECAVRTGFSQEYVLGKINFQYFSILTANIIQGVQQLV